MVPTVAPRSRRLLEATFRCTAHQRRFKTFVRRVDKNDQVYYTVTKAASRNPNLPAESNDFFDMPNLLLDLDAEGSKNVRSYEESDEQVARDNWAVNPTRRDVKAKLKHLEEQVYESRRRADEMLSQPTNAWRVTNHDILSAALRGAPRRAVNSQTSDSAPGEHTQSGKASAVLERIRLENGIPEHAASEDESFLQWMLLRRRSLINSQRAKTGATPSTAQLLESLKQQTCITGIRRLVFQYLASGGDFSGFKENTAARQSSESSSPALGVRNACAAVLDSNSRDPISAVETLTFLRNLEWYLARLNRKGRAEPARAGGPLSQLAAELEGRVQRGGEPETAHAI